MIDALGDAFKKKWETNNIPETAKSWQTYDILSQFKKLDLHFQATANSAFI